MKHSSQLQEQSFPVFRSDMLLAMDGANMGDGLSFAAELVPDDIYELQPHAKLGRLTLLAGDGKVWSITDSSELGDPGGDVHLDSCLTWMTREGETLEMIILVAVDAEGHATEVYGLPLAPMELKAEYRLVGSDRENAQTRLAQVACGSFSRGTLITLASGEQCPVEDLRAGHKVLTRDSGIQPIRWIGQTTVRAVGDFAPVAISAGALHNTNDLVISPDHRLFIYQRSDALGAGRSEVLVKARHLVNGDSIYFQNGGFIDYFQLLFDQHQIIFAEGIAAETFLVNTRTQPALPPDLAAKLAEILPSHADRAHLEFEVNKALLDRPDAAELLRRATRG